MPPARLIGLGECFPSESGPAAIDTDRGAGDLAGGLGTQEHRGAADLFNRRHFPAGLARQHDLTQHGFTIHTVFAHRVGDLRLNQRGQDIAGADRVVECAGKGAA